MSARDRALGAFHGLAIGDALGMPTQSMSREDILIHYGFIRSFRDAVAEQPISPNLPAGTITDDTEQALLVADLLIAGGGRIDPEKFAGSLLAWESQMLARGLSDLLGPSTKRALKRLEAGVDPEESGREGTTNGAAMRITPIAIATPPDTNTLVDAVVDASKLTHNTNVGIAGAAAVAAAISAGIAGADLPEALDHAEQAAALGSRRGWWHPGGDVACRIRWVRRWVRGMDPTTLSYAVAKVIGTSVDVHESVIAAFALAQGLGDTPFDALTTAAGLGGDTDTIAAILGAILGAQHGMTGLPTDLVTTVCEVNNLELEPVVDGLLALRHAEQLPAGVSVSTDREQPEAPAESRQ